MEDDTKQTAKGKYVIVTELEFDTLFKADKGWKKEVKYNEYVYSFKTKKNPDVTVLVYSSVSPNGLGKKCGADAIRVCAINTRTNKGILKSNRVNRTPGWEERVKNKVLETIKKIF